MKKDNIKLYTLEILFIVILFFVFLAVNVLNYYIILCIMGLFCGLTCLLFKRQKSNKVNQSKLMILMIILGLMFVALFYALGLYYGFLKSKYPSSWWTIYTFIIPISGVIVFAEIIRNRLLSKGSKISIGRFKLDISSLFVFLSMILVDFLIYTEKFDFSNLDNAMKIVGFVIFSSLSNNLLFNSISTYVGSKNIIIYRLITTLFVFLIPFTPDVAMLFQITYKLLYPVVVYLIIDNVFLKEKQQVSKVKKGGNVLATSLLVALIVSFVLLISCQFRFGILVIGSHSMSGTIERGDAIIYESYKDQDIDEGQVIVFDYNGIKTVHRVIDIEKVNGEIRIYTQGDANDRPDTGYIDESKVYGLVKYKVKYIGHPTLWLRDLFS